jgi:hypothetical protein
LIVDLKTAGAIVGIAVGSLALLGSVSTYFQSAAHTEDAVKQLEGRENGLHNESKQAINDLRKDIERLRDGLTKLEKEEAVDVGKLQGRLDAVVADLDGTKKWLTSVAGRSLHGDAPK